MINDLQKAERFTDAAADFYESIVNDNYSIFEYARLKREYADVDVLDILPEIYALRLHEYESRGWKRQRERVFRKSRRYEKICERVIA